jgi:hypothetical protein
MNEAEAASVSITRNTKQQTMKTHSNKKQYITLGDMISAVSDYAQNERETLAAIQDLFRKGSVVAKTRHGSKRLKLA